MADAEETRRTNERDQLRALQANGFFADHGISILHDCIRTFLPDSIVDGLLPHYIHPSFFPLLEEQIRSDVERWKEGWKEGWRKTTADYPNVFHITYHCTPIPFLEMLYQLGFSFSSRPYPCSLYASRPDLFQWRLSKGDLEAIDLVDESSGETLLIHLVLSTKELHSDNVLRVLAMGADPSLQDKRGNTALHYALYLRNKERQFHEPWLEELDRTIHALLLSGTRMTLESNATPFFVFPHTMASAYGRLSTLLWKERKEDPSFLRAFPRMRREMKIRRKQILREMAPMVEGLRRVYAEDGTFRGLAKDILQ